MDKHLEEIERMKRECDEMRVTMEAALAHLKEDGVLAARILLAAALKNGGAHD